MNKVTQQLAQSRTRVKNGAACRGIIKAGFSCIVYINNKSGGSLYQHLIWSVCFSGKIMRREEVTPIKSGTCLPKKTIYTTHNKLGI